MIARRLKQTQVQESSPWLETGGIFYHIVHISRLSCAVQYLVLKQEFPRVPFSLVPKNTGLGPSMGNPSSNFRIAGWSFLSIYLNCLISMILGCSVGWTNSYEGYQCCNRTQLQSLSSPPSSLFKTSSPRNSPARCTTPSLSAIEFFLGGGGKMKKMSKKFFQQPSWLLKPKNESQPSRGELADPTIYNDFQFHPSDHIHMTHIVHLTHFRQVSLCSPRDPSSIVDMYCDDEFALSLEFHPNMLLYPVQGVSSSMEAELTKIDGNHFFSTQLSDKLYFPGSFLSMSLNSTHSSLVSSSGEEEVVSVLSVNPQNSWTNNILVNQSFFWTNRLINKLLVNQKSECLVNWSQSENVWTWIYLLSSFAGILKSHTSTAQEILIFTHGLNLIHSKS